MSWLKLFLRSPPSPWSLLGKLLLTLQYSAQGVASSRKPSLTASPQAQMVGMLPLGFHIPECPCHGVGHVLLGSCSLHWASGKGLWRIQKTGLDSQWGLQGRAQPRAVTWLSSRLAAKCLGQVQEEEEKEP